MKKLLNDYNLLDVKCKYDLGGNRNIYIWIEVIYLSVEILIVERLIVERINLKYGNINNL
jgi:hypothetical protein